MAQMVSRSVFGTMSSPKTQPFLDPDCAQAYRSLERTLGASLCARRDGRLHTLARATLEAYLCALDGQRGLPDEPVWATFVCNAAVLCGAMRRRTERCADVAWRHALATLDQIVDENADLLHASARVTEATLKARTRSTAIGVEPHEVFAYVSRPENLPAWARPFAQSVRREGDHWIATGPGGELRFLLDTDEEHGIVDFLSPNAAGAYVLRALSRVVPNDAGTSAYLFTLFALPEENDAAFAARLATVEGELAALRTILESRAVPAPAGV
jgi:hypothetical protein